MKMQPLRYALPALALSALALAAARGSSTEAAGTIKFADVNGRAYTSKDIAASKASVFIFASTQCPISNLYMPRIAELAAEYGKRGVRVYVVDSNREDTAAALRGYAKERSLAIPVVKDEGTALADTLGAHTTPEAVIVDPSGAVQYRGRIDDNRDREKVVRRHVREALDCILAGKPVAVARTIPFGCAIFRDGPPAPNNGGVKTVTWAKDVAPILNRNCVVCHRKGEVAPFALESYQQAKTWAGQIKDYTAHRLMPPWKAVPGFGDFVDSRYLSQTDIDTIGRWAECGAPMGDANAAPPTPKFRDPATWALGTPDVVLQSPRPYHLGAEGRDVYRNFVMPIDLTQDRYIRAIEFKPDNRAIVHHVVTYIDPSGQSAQMDGKEKEPGYTVPGIGIGVFDAVFGEVWVPGSDPRVLPDGTAVKVPKGAKLVMQVHYHKSGKPEIDQTKMAIYWAKGRVQQIVHTTAMGDFSLQIKPGDANHAVKTSWPIPMNIHLRSAFPHMHMIGKTMRITAKLPDGTEKKLCYIDDWDFNWQTTYYYKEPVALPKGSTLILEASYDNSEHNPHQTSHPPKLVHFGEQTTDEMCFFIFGMTIDNEKLNVVADAGLPRTGSAR